MKNYIKTCVFACVFIVAAVLCETAQADIMTPVVTAYPGGSTWVTDPNGNSPFYSSGDLSTSGNFSPVGPPATAGGATASLLAETFTITNGAGTNGLASSLTANTNYVVTGISMLASGFSTTPVSLHIFDVTSNLTGGVTASGASYDFTANGDLLGGGNGLDWTNNQLSGVEQQIYLGLQNGPGTQDQIVLAANHTYAVEVWVASGTGAFDWFKSSAAPQDIGGEAMAGANTSLSASRITGSASGFYGSSQHTFALALYGSPTAAAPSVNNNTNQVPVTTYTVDQFNDPGYGPTNSYVGTNDYSLGQITNIWINWFGTAWYTNEWDPTSDAQSNPNSGSLKITGIFPDSGLGGSGGAQFVVMDNYNGINPSLNGFQITGFQCDIRFDPASASEIDASVTNFGTVEFGSRGIDYGQHDFGSINVPVTQTNWVHVSLPVDAISDASITNIPNVYIKMYSGTRTGTTILWVDNIKLTGPSEVVTQAPPVLSIEKAVPALRIFAGSTANTYDREELATVDQSQSWIGGSYPVTYSFKLLSAANFNGFQTHIFLVPVNSLPSGNNVYGNEFVEYQASNNLWLQIVGNASGSVTANISWKTNTPNANPNIVALNITNSTAVGTWTVKFSDASSGTLTAPGAIPVAFTIADPNVATDFANPVVAIFGLQPQSTAAYGAYQDYGQITISGVAGNATSDDFTMDTAISSSWDITDSAAQSSLVLVSTNTPYWVSWSLPAANFGLGTAMDIRGNTNTSAPWMLPEYYNNYNDGNDLPNQAKQGLRNWGLIPSTCLPTLDGQPGGPVSPNAFFQLFNPPLAN